MSSRYSLLLSLCCVVFYCVVICCVVLRFIVLCCVVLCYAVLGWVVLCSLVSILSISSLSLSLILSISVVTDRVVNDPKRCFPRRSGSTIRIPGHKRDEHIGVACIRASSSERNHATMKIRIRKDLRYKTTVRSIPDHSSF